MSIQQALCASNTDWDSSKTFSFTTDLTTHEGGASGSNPTAGNDLIVLINSSETPTACDTNQSDTGVQDYSFGGGWYAYRIANISASVTSITVTLANNQYAKVYVFEDSATLTEEDNEAFGATDDGFVTTHTEEYTTATTDELVLCVVTSTAVSGSFSGSSGSSALAVDTSEDPGVIYKDVTAIETADIEWVMGSATNCSAGIITYSRSGGGGGTSPKGPFGHPFNGPFGGPI